MKSELIRRAVELRDSGRHVESRALLNPFLDDPLLSGSANLHTAWSLDNEGLENSALKYYRAALCGYLSEEERFDALFGMASTLRSLGKYADALDMFDKTVLEYPNKLEIVPFYCMCLYNLGRDHEAISRLLNLLLKTTSSKEILTYKRAISLYLEDLDKIWDMENSIEG